MADVSETQKKSYLGCKKKLKFFLKISFCVCNMIKEPAGGKSFFLKYADSKITF